MRNISLEIVSILSLSIAGAFLLATYASILTKNSSTTAGRKLTKFSVKPFKVWNRSKVVRDY